MSDLLAQWSERMMDNYGTPPLALVSGSGATVVDEQGRSHIDMLAGIAVNSLGYGHPALVRSISEQAAKLGHTSNLFASAPALSVAGTLIQRFARDDAALAAATRVFFCNSGAEANEAAFKIARLTGRSRILAAVNGFHGRTMGALALTGQPDKRNPFAPLPTGVEFFPYGDAGYLAKLVAVNPKDVAAIVLEPIQGETGVIPAPEGFLAAARQLCDAHGILLIFDEVQTGVGRTGTFFAHQAEGVTPDVATMAKGLGGGLPIGACLAHGPAAKLFTPGSHGTTFGGNPVACAAAEAVLEIIDDDFCQEVTAKGAWLKDALEALPGVEQVRGRGLMLGAVLRQPIARQAVARGFDFGVILNAPNERVIRLTPPLVISGVELREGVARITELLHTLEGEHP